MQCFSKKPFLALSLICLLAGTLPSFAADKASDDDLFSESDSGAEAHNTPQDGPSGVYIQAGLGYALTYMRNRIGTPVGGNWKSHAGGFTYGGDLGYQINNLFSVEAGAFGLPTSKLNMSGTNLSSTFTTWAAYVAGKMRVYLYDRTHLFAKFGLSYQQTKLSGNGPILTTTNPEHQWGAMFGFGTEYNFTPSWIMSMQYLRMPGRVRNTALNGTLVTTSLVPDSNVLFVSIGYLFGQGADQSESTL